MVYNGGMERTQIYLNPDQKRKLRLIAADEGTNVSDLIRSAIDRLIRDEVRTGNIGERIARWQDDVRRNHGDFSEEDVDSALAAVRSEKVAKK